MNHFAELFGLRNAKIARFSYLFFFSVAIAMGTGACSGEGSAHKQKEELEDFFDGDESNGDQINPNNVNPSSNNNNGVNGDNGGNNNGPINGGGNNGGGNNGGGNNGGGNNEDGTCTNSNVNPGGVAPGGLCHCSDECQGSSVNPGLCVYGICMQQATAPCSGGGSTSECSAGFQCWGLQETNYDNLCWPDCDAFTCHGTCDSDGSCTMNSNTDCDSSCSLLCSGTTTTGGNLDLGNNAGGNSGDGSNNSGGSSNGGSSNSGSSNSGGTSAASPGVAPIGTVGALCRTDNDCGSAAPNCVTNGWPGGYCTVLNCTGGCPTGSDCYQFGMGDGSEVTMCMDKCAATSDCRRGYSCYDESFICAPSGDGDGGYRCTDSSCPNGQFCADNGQCIPRATDLPSGPIPSCTGGTSGIPAWDNVTGGVVGMTNIGATNNSTFKLYRFNPRLANGYWDYEINQEGASQYRSWIRKDVMGVVRYATAMTECLSSDWDYQGFMPLGLGDMSEENGDIPGAQYDAPGHPDGTHEGGSDMDIAYYQLGQMDNTLRSVCIHVSGGQDVSHCVSQPHLLDKWRTAVFIAKLHDNPALRVIGVDGKVGPIVEDAVQQLCAADWIDGPACTNLKLTYEVTNGGAGWYYFHHHHLHVSYSESMAMFGPSWLPNEAAASDRCLVPGGCRSFELQSYVHPLSQVKRYVRPVKKR